MNQAYTFYLRLYIIIYIPIPWAPQTYIFLEVSLVDKPGFLVMAQTSIFPWVVGGLMVYDDCNEFKAWIGVIHHPWCGYPHLSKAGWVDQGTRQVGVAGAHQHRWGTETEPKRSWEFGALAMETSQWKLDLLKMYFLLKMEIFQYHTVDGSEIRRSPIDIL